MKRALSFQKCPNFKNLAHYFTISSGKPLLVIVAEVSSCSPAKSSNLEWKSESENQQKT